MSVLRRNATSHNAFLSVAFRTCRSSNSRTICTTHHSSRRRSLRGTASTRKCWKRLRRGSRTESQTQSHRQASHTHVRDYARAAEETWSRNNPKITNTQRTTGLRVIEQHIHIALTLPRTAPSCPTTTHVRAPKKVKQLPTCRSSGSRARHATHHSSCRKSRRGTPSKRKHLQLGSGSLSPLHEPLRGVWSQVVK